MIITSPASAEEFARYYDLRWRVLRKPWGQPPGSERDRLEDESIHVMAGDNDRMPVGIGRIHFPGAHEAQIRYMAVEESYRGRGFGKAVLARLEEIARKRGVVRIILNAREGALPFYERSGYRVLGTGHTLFGCIRHARMEKRFHTGIGKKRQDDQP